MTQFVDFKAIIMRIHIYYEFHLIMIIGYLVTAILTIFYQFKGNNSSTAIDSLTKLDVRHIV